MGNAIFSNLMKSAENATKDILKTISAIIDENSFVETDKFIYETTDLGEAVGEGVVSGFAHISDLRVGLFAMNSKVLKGSIGKANSKKIVKLINSSVSNNLPVIGILDTFGARFDEGIDAMEGYSEIFGALSNAYGMVPTTIVVKGADFGLSAYFCAVSDICIAYSNAQIATSSPLILAGNTKEDPAKICTSAFIAETSDVITNVVKNDKELGEILSTFLQTVCIPVGEEKDELNRVAKATSLKNTESVLSEIFDKESILKIRNSFAKEVKTGFARLGGISVGFAAVDGKLTADGATKITELLNTCESFSLPVINFVNCDGCETVAATDGKVIRAVSDMMFTYNSMSTPKLALIHGNAIGLGYTAFAAKNNFDYSIAWADAKIGVMESESAARLIYKDEISNAADKDKAIQKLSQTYSEENMLAPVVAQKGYIDNVIESTLSRPYLIAALQIYISKE